MAMLTLQANTYHHFWMCFPMMPNCMCYLIHVHVDNLITVQMCSPSAYRILIYCNKHALNLICVPRWEVPVVFSPSMSVPGYRRTSSLLVMPPTWEMMRVGGLPSGGGPPWRKAPRRDWCTGAMLAPLTTAVVYCVNRYNTLGTVQKLLLERANDFEFFTSKNGDPSEIFPNLNAPLWEFAKFGCPLQEFVINGCPATPVSKYGSLQYPKAYNSPPLPLNHPPSWSNFWMVPQSHDWHVFLLKIVRSEWLKQKNYTALIPY